MEKEEKIEEYTKYEKARMIGSRALQLSMGAPFILKLKKEDLEEIKYNPIEIAKMEYEKDVLPITVRRPMPHKGA
jgi:DNA-directed RNA polymerase subunit K